MCGNEDVGSGGQHMGSPSGQWPSSWLRHTISCWPPLHPWCPLLHLYYFLGIPLSLKLSAYIIGSDGQLHIFRSRKGNSGTRKVRTQHPGRQPDLHMYIETMSSIKDICRKIVLESGEKTAFYCWDSSEVSAEHCSVPSAEPSHFTSPLPVGYLQVTPDSPIPTRTGS